MPVTMGGMASGVDTDDIIKKLVEVEARPIMQWEQDKIVYNRRKDALVKLKSHLNKINNAAKNLYGFRASYDAKKSISSNSSVITAKANKFAELGNRQIQVLNLASIHKITTDAVKKNDVLPQGKFKLEVDGIARTVRFKGGTLKSLQERIDADASEIVTTSYINTKDDNYVMSLQSKTPGEKGEIQISGSPDLLNQIGLTSGRKDQKKEKVVLVFDPKYFVSYSGDTKKDSTGTIDVDKEGRFFDISGILWREYILPTEIDIKKSSVFEFEVTYTEPEKEEDKAIPYRLEMGPSEKTVIKGIELNSYNVSRTRPLEKKKQVKEITDIVGIGIIGKANNKRIEKLYPVSKDFKGKMEIPIGKDFAGKRISKVIFYCNKGKARFAKALVYTPLKGTGLLAPKNEISKAKDAKFKVDGVEMARDRNEGLNDVIKGITLNLHDKSKVPVQIKIEPDIEKALKNIQDFVESYNKYIDFNNVLIKAERSNKPGDFKKNRSKNGLFMGDMTIIRLENSLKQAVSNAYPNRAEKPIKLITQMGISTGAINASWNSIKEGKLVVDENKLQKVIRENPEGVEEFFGSDTDGDTRIDGGMAHNVENLLRPYIMTGKSIISSKIDLEDTKIKSADDRIERHRDHISRYEAKLRQKFSTMEKSISGAKSQQNWLKNQMKGLSGSSEEK